MSGGGEVEVGVAVTLQTPALLSSGPPAANLLETLEFIPGNTLRGLFARRYLDVHDGKADERFEELFVRGAVRFGFGFRGGAEPIPLSARSCKYHEGFLADGKHGVVDALLPREGDGCPRCGSPLDYARGFWLPDQPRRMKTDTRLLTRTAIDPGTGRARSGQLYSQRVLEEGQTFRAAIASPEPDAPAMRELLGNGFEARLGTGASRGQGWCRVEPIATQAAAGETARARYERFRAAAARPVLAITLLSDALFSDDYLRDGTVPSAADLRALGLDSEEWEPRPARAFVEVRRLFGFDGGPIHLPRPARLAVRAGSAYLYERRADGPRGEPAIPEGDGSGWLGDRQREGYGRARLWHPFHLVPEGGAW